jgi:hypothetical protein
MIAEITIRGLLFADYLVVPSFTCNNQQWTIDKLKRLCEECNLKCNLDK